MKRRSPYLTRSVATKGVFNFLGARLFGHWHPWDAKRDLNSSVQDYRKQIRLNPRYLSADGRSLHYRE